MTAEASNARQVTVVEYDRDPRGASLFRRLAGVHARGVTGHDTRPVYDPVSTWHGQIAGRQRFMGQAQLGLGARPPVHEVAPELSDTRSAGLADPAQQLFAARAARRLR